ncbi:methionine--tRNA ligase [Candidatus Bathyarchaeota archaeon]|nr:methionine--tRNA ligase [Candidatus Bathyarchaeota archaeon]
MEEKNTFYVTTPIYYVNDNPHIGHAYTTMAADIIARFYRLLGREVYFLTGTDEHGEKLEIAAENAGLEPKEFVDNVVKKFQNLWKLLEISNDDFIRTTDTRHVEFCKKIFLKMKERGDIYKGYYEGLYCVGCESFIRKVDLVDGKCPQHDQAPKLVKEESYFFKMSKYQEPLLDFYKKNPDFISPPSKRKGIMNLLSEGLKDLSISRKSISWGIPIPGDPEHVMYVWIDALSNYISALKYGSDLYKKFWPADVHLIGKDIKWFHMVIWPTMLMSAGLPLPRKVFAHGFWNVDGVKMSKTLGNVVDPVEMVNLYGLESFRYYLFKKAQFGQDNDFSERELVDVLNTELADDLGNLVNRIIVLVQKYFKGEIHVPEERTTEEEQVETRFNIVESIIDQYKQFKFSKVLKQCWKLLRWMNKYISETEPWVIHKQGDMERLKNVLYILLEGIRIIAIFFKPVLPGTSKKILTALNLPPQDLSRATWRNKHGYKDGMTLAKKKLILFNKMEYSEKREKEMDEPKIKDAKPEITFDIFSKIDMRSAEIVSAEAFPDSSKLVKLEVECGPETRTVVAGIAKYYSLDELEGKTVIMVVNLKPRKIHGVLSEAMLLAVDVDNEPFLLVPDKAVESGFPVL